MNDNSKYTNEKTQYAPRILFPRTVFIVLIVV